MTIFGVRSERTGEILRPFDEEDYLRYVDGKAPLRRCGEFPLLTWDHARARRSIGSAGIDTVCALGNLKDRDFERAVTEEGVTLFESTIAFLRTLRSLGISTALISSSRHARAILEAAADITDLFDAIVDGIDAEDPRDARQA